MGREGPPYCSRTAAFAWEEGGFRENTGYLHGVLRLSWITQVGPHKRSEREGNAMTEAEVGVMRPVSPGMLTASRISAGGESKKGPKHGTRDAKETQSEINAGFRAKRGGRGRGSRGATKRDEGREDSSRTEAWALRLALRRGWRPSGLALTSCGPHPVTPAAGPPSPHAEVWPSPGPGPPGF